MQDDAIVVTPGATPTATAARRRLDTIDWPPIALAAVALVVLVWLGRDMTFYHDEWALILKRDLSVDGILAPHNEHLSATLVVLYRVLLGTVGMGSYWPYLGVTFALHLAVAGLVYVIVRREAPAGWALGAMAVMLFLGRAATTSCGPSSRRRSERLRPASGRWSSRRGDPRSPLSC